MAGVDTLKALFDEKRILVLQLFIQQPQEKFTLQEVVKKTKVPLATVHRLLKKLTRMDLLQQEKQKHLTLYRLSNSSDAQYLTKLLYEKPMPIEEFVRQLRSISNIQRVIMHGKATDSRANVVIIGEGIDKEAVNSAVTKVREDFNFTVSHLILAEEQFNMLEQMNQFSGAKTTLLENN